MSTGTGRDFAQLPAPADPPTTVSLERRLLSDEAMARAVRRRWPALALLLAAGLVGREVGAVPASAPDIVLALLAAGLANAALQIVGHRGWSRPWLLYPSALLDVSLAALAVVWFGPGGIIVLFLLAVLPHTVDLGRWGSVAIVVIAAFAYLLAAALHTAVFGGSTLGPRVIGEAVLFTAAALALMRIPAGLLGRVRRARAVMSEAEQGFLAVRAPAVDADEVGFLERSLNRMLDEIGATFSAVQRESDEVAAFAEQLAAAAEQLHASSESITASARVLATDLSAQRGVADASRLESAKAADQAGALRTRAELMQADAERLTAAANRGRERVERASRTLRDIGDEVRGTAASVSGLAGMSERIGAFAQTIARIARQTHLLALNAAIEAARAEEHGEGFAVVASEVRALAAESARSAREVAELVADLRSGIDAAVRAMHAGETKVRDVGIVAGEAEQALQELQQGVQVIGDLVNATAQVSRSQAQRLADLATSLERVASISTAAAGRAEGAAAATTAQIAAMSDLTATSQQLAELAERLRAGIARFSVLRRDQATAEHRAVRPAAD